MRKNLVIIALMGALLSSSANASQTEFSKNKTQQNQNEKSEIVLSKENCTRTENSDYVENIAMDANVGANEGELPPNNKEKTAAITTSPQLVSEPLVEEEVKA